MAKTLGGGGKYKEPDETVLTKVEGTVIVAVQSVDTQPAGFIGPPSAFW